MSKKKSNDEPMPPPQCPECGDHVEFEEGMRIVTLVDHGGPYEFHDDPDDPRPPGGWPKCDACSTPEKFAEALAAQPVG